MSGQHDRTGSAGRIADHPVRGRRRAHPSASCSAASPADTVALRADDLARARAERAATVCRTTPCEHGQRPLSRVRAPSSRRRFVTAEPLLFGRYRAPVGSWADARHALVLMVGEGSGGDAGSGVGVGRGTAGRLSAHTPYGASRSSLGHSNVVDRSSRVPGQVVHRHPGDRCQHAADTRLTAGTFSPQSS
jgi:hypothetical protein